MNLVQKRVSVVGVFICLLLAIPAHAVDVAPRITDREIIEGLTDLKGRSKHLEIKMDERFDAVNQRFESLESTMDKRFDAVNQRFESLESTMDERFDAVDQRFESLESKVDERFNAVNQRFEAVDQRFESVNQRFESLESTMDQRFDAIDDQFGRIWSLMLVIIAGIFGLIGFIIWDRRTVLKPVEQRLVRMESYLEHDLEIKHEEGSRMTRLIKVLREMARDDERLAAVLRSFSLM